MITNRDDKRFQMQDSAYEFPYHYLPELTDKGIHIYRSIDWALEYLTYVTYVRDRVLELKPQSILDVGCGDGRLLNLIGNSVSVRTGVDLSEQAIAFARAFNPDANWFHCAAADVPGSFDLVTCIETLEHIPDSDMSDFVSAMHSKLVSDGTLILSVPTVVRRVNRKHWRHYTLDLLESHLAPFFSIQESVYLFRDDILTGLLNRILRNRFFLLEHSLGKRTVWNLHRRRSFFASAKNGTHIVAICRNVQDKGTIQIDK